MNSKVVSLLMCCVILQATHSWATAIDPVILDDTDVSTILTANESSPIANTSFWDSVDFGIEDEDGDGKDEDYEYFEESTEGLFPKSLYLFFVYFVFIFGVTGNLLVFALMHEKSLRSSSYSIYLRFLALMDTLVLITVCTEDILEHQFRTLERTIFSSSLCRLWSWVQNMSALTSPWFVLAFTADRYIAVVFPFQRKTLSTRRIALVVSLVITAITALGSIVIQLAGEFVENPDADPDNRHCQNYHNDHFERYKSFQILFLQSTFPCAVILYFNLHIIIGIKRSSRFRSSSRDQDKEKAKADSRITVSLVAVSLMAFCCLTPVSVTEVIEMLIMNKMDDSFPVFTNTTDMAEYDKLNRHILGINQIWPLLNLIKLCNFGQNFYVMMASCHRYREVFVAMVCVPRLRQSSIQMAKT